MYRARYYHRKDVYSLNPFLIEEDNRQVSQSNIITGRAVLTDGLGPRFIGTSGSPRYFHLLLHYG